MKLDFLEGTIATEIYDEETDRLKRVRMTFDEFRAYNERIEKKFIDYRGNKFLPIQRFSYLMCDECGKYVHEEKVIAGVCPLCIFQIPNCEIEIRFTDSRSKNFPKAVKIAASMEFNYLYDKIKSLHILRFWDLSELRLYAGTVKKLLPLISKWKSFKITLNGECLSSNELYAILSEIKFL